jgi:hypothetical protein
MFLHLSSHWCHIPLNFFKLLKTIRIFLIHLTQINPTDIKARDVAHLQLTVNKNIRSPVSTNLSIFTDKWENEISYFHEESPHSNEDTPLSNHYSDEDIIFFDCWERGRQPIEI